MSEVWETVPLSEVTLKIGSGATPRGGKSVYVDRGTAFIRSQNVYDNRFSRQGLAHIDADAADALKGVTVEAGDVLIDITGESVTRTCIVPSACLPARVSQHVSIIRPNPQKLDSRFLAATLLSPSVKAYLNLLSSAGATRRALTKGHLQELVIALPPLPEQQRIAEVLVVFDELIQTNRQLREDAEDLGRSLVVDLASGALDAVKGATVPDGWEILTMGEATSTVETGSRPRGGVRSITSGTPSIGAESIGGLGVFDFDKTKFVSTDFADSMRRGWLQSRDILVYKDGGKPGEFRPHVGMFGDGFPYERMTINEHVYRVRAAEPLSEPYLYFWLSTPELFDAMATLGTGAAIPGLNSTNFKSLPVAVPPALLRERLFPVLDSLVSVGLGAAREAHELVRVRDEILPLLLSREITVRDVAS